MGEIDRILFGSHNVDGLKVITASVPNADTGRLRQMGDVLRDKDASVVAVLATVNEGKITFHSADGKQTRLRIGYVPQSPAFDRGDPVSVMDLFTCCIFRRPAFLRPMKAMREKVLACLENVHGEALIDKRIGALSGGELQRVLLALALEPMPNILILDEPLSGVDVEGMSLLMDMLDEIRKKFDLSILMTTHDFTMLEQYCDQVVLLQGKILRRGTPLDVLNSEEFAQAFHMGGGAQA